MPQKTNLKNAILNKTNGIDKMHTHLPLRKTCQTNWANFSRHHGQRPRYDWNQKFGCQLLHFLKVIMAGMSSQTSRDGVMAKMDGKLGLSEWISGRSKSTYNKGWWHSKTETNLRENGSLEAKVKQQSLSPTTPTAATTTTTTTTTTQAPAAAPVPNASLMISISVVIIMIYTWFEISFGVSQIMITISYVYIYMHL